MTFFPRPGKRVAGVRGGVAPAMSAQPVLGRAMRFGRPSRKKSAQDIFSGLKIFHEAGFGFISLIVMKLYD